jgi:hypothetical protein
LVPLAVKGFFKDNVFMPILVWLCVASYSIVVFPWFAFSHYWWWILLLPIPLTVYAGNALERFGFFVWGKHFRRVVLGFLLLGVVGIGYACSAIKLGYPYAYTYVPSGLVESCVDFVDISSIKEAFIWASAHLPLNAVVVVPERFQGFASMYSTAFARADLKIHVAPALLEFRNMVAKITENNDVFYAILFLEEVDTCENISVLAEFEEVGVYEIDISP